MARTTKSKRKIDPGAVAAPGPYSPDLRGPDRLLRRWSWEMPQDTYRAGEPRAVIGA